MIGIWNADNPRPWLISTARFKAIDTLRRRARFDASHDELVRYLAAQSSSAESSNEEDSLEDDPLEDDRLRLIFTCCHPSGAEANRRDRKGSPHHCAYAGAAHFAGKGDDSRERERHGGYELAYGSRLRRLAPPG